MAAPKFQGTGAVLVLHSWWGLNGFFRRLCDRFADEGFVALAPDLYGGRVAGTVAEARRLRADAYEPGAAALAWTRTIEFLNLHMGRGTP